MSNLKRVTNAALRRTSAALVLLVCLAPSAGAAQRCDTTQVEDLAVRYASAPRSVTAGTTVTLAVDVHRAGGTPAQLGAEGVDILVGLSGSSWGVYDRVVSDAQGHGEVLLAVPAGVKGRTRMEVEVVRELVSAPCLRVEEHGRVVKPWGPVR